MANIYNKRKLDPSLVVMLVKDGDDIRHVIGNVCYTSVCLDSVY